MAVVLPTLAGCIICALIAATAHSRQVGLGNSNQERITLTGIQEATPLDVVYRTVPVEQWPPAEAADMLEISRAQWNNWLIDLRTKRLPPASLKSWTWNASFDPQAATLSGKLRLNVSHRPEREQPALLPLGQFSAALISSQTEPGSSQARWIGEDSNETEPAILGNQPNGKLALLADRSGAVALTAAQRADARFPREHRFTLELPAAPRRILRLELPFDWEPRLPNHQGATYLLNSEVGEADVPATRQWEIVLAAGGRTSLILTRTSDETNSAPDTLPTVQEKTTYRADRGELLVTTHWQIRFPANAAKALQIQMPRELNLQSLAADGREISPRKLNGSMPQPVPDSPELRPQQRPTSEQQRIELEILPSWAGRTVALSAVASHHLPERDQVVLPRLILPEVFWQTGTVRVRVLSPLRLADLQFANAEISSYTALDDLEARLMSPAAELRLAVERRRGGLHAEMATRLLLEEAQLRANCSIRFLQDFGSRSAIQLAIADEWKIENVQFSADGRPQNEVLVAWERPVTDGMPDALIDVQLPHPIVGHSEFTISILARRDVGARSDLSLAEAIPASPLEARLRENVMALASSGGTSELNLLGAEESASAVSSHSDDNLPLTVEPGDTIYRLKFPPTHGRLIWGDAQNQGAVSIQVHAELTEAELRETFHVTGLPNAMQRETLFYVSESRTDGVWTWATGQDEPVEASRLSTNELAERSLADDVEVWRIHAFDNADGHLIATRTSPATRWPVVVSLASPLGSTVSSGEVVVAFPAEVYASLAQHPDDVESSLASIKPIWPLPTDFSTDISRRVVRYAFSPIDLASNQRSSPLMIRRKQEDGENAASHTESAVSPAEPIIWHETLHWTLHSNGESLCRVECHVQSRHAEELAFTLPPNAKLIEVRADDQPLRWTDDGQLLRVSIPVEPAYKTIQLQYRVSHTAIGLSGEFTVPWPEFSAIVFERIAKLQLPWGTVRTDADSRHQIVSSTVSLIANRLLGPASSWSEFPAATTRRQALSESGTALAKRFLANARSAVSAEIARTGTTNSGSSPHFNRALQHLADEWQANGYQLLIDLDRISQSENALDDLLMAKSIHGAEGTETIRHAMEQLGLALAVINDHTLAITSLHALQSSGLYWIRSDDRLVFELDSGTSGDSEWLTTLIRPDSSSAPPVSPWPRNDDDRQSLATFDGDAIYLLNGATKVVSVAHAERQASLNKFLLVIAGIIGWTIIHRHRYWALSICATLTAGSLLAPSSYSQLVSGLPLGFGVGVIVAVLAIHSPSTVNATQRRLLRTLKLGTLLLGMGVVLWSNVATATNDETALSQERLFPPPRVSPSQEEGQRYLVFVRVDGQGKPDGTHLFAPRELVTEIQRRLDETNMRPRGYLLTAAEHRVRATEGGLVSSRAVELSLTLRVHSFEDEARVELPLRQSDYQQIPQTALVFPAGRESVIEWEDVQATLTIQGVGKHTIDLEMVSTDAALLRPGQLRFTVPAISGASVEIAQPDEDIAGRQVEMTGDFVRVRQFANAGMSHVVLGPANSLQLTLRSQDRAFSPQQPVKILSWLRFSGGTARLSARILFFNDSHPDSIVLRFPPTLRLEGTAVDGRVTSANLAGNINTQGSITDYLTIPLPSSMLDRREVSLEFSFRDRRPTGRWRFPRLHLANSPSQVQFWGVGVDQRWRISELERRQLADISPEAFAVDWGAVELPRLVARPIAETSSWQIAIQPVATEANSYLEAEAVIGRSGCEYVFKTSVALPAQQRFLWQVEIPEALEITDVSVRDEAGREVIRHWSTTSGKLVVLTSGVPTGLLRLEIQASEGWTEFPALYRPKLLRFSSVNEGGCILTVFRRENIQAIMPVGSTPAAIADPHVAPPDGTQLIGVFPIEAQTGTSPNIALQSTAASRGRLTTRLFREHGNWHATVTLLAEEGTYVPDDFLLDIPGDWRMDPSPVPGWHVTFDPNHDGDLRRFQLRRSERHLQPTITHDQYQWQLRLTLPSRLSAPQQVPVLAELGRSAEMVERVLIVPRAVGGSILEWDIEGLERDPATPETFSLSVDRTFEIRQVKALLSLKTSLVGTSPQFPLVVAQVVETGRPSIAVTYHLHPRGTTSVQFQLPAKSSLTSADINGLPAQTRMLSDRICEVTLWSSWQPQRIGLGLVSSSQPDGGDAGSSLCQIPEPLDIPIEETLWLGDGIAPGLTNQQPPRRLNQIRVAQRVFEQLRLEWLSQESPSTLLAELLSREVLSKSPKVADGVLSGQGTSTQLATYKSGDSNSVSVENFWPAASAATVWPRDRYAYLFRGSQLQVKLANDEPPSTSWPRSVIALGLLATATLFIPRRAFGKDSQMLPSAQHRSLILPTIAIGCSLLLGAWIVAIAIAIAGVIWGVWRTKRRATAVANGTSLSQ